MHVMELRMRTYAQLLVAVLLSEVVLETAAQVQCYECAYINKDGPSQKCPVETSCNVCQTTFYHGGDNALVKRACMGRCEPGGVPVIYENIEDSSAIQTCCTTDLCNVHPSAGIKPAALTVLCLFAVLSAYWWSCV